MKKHVSLLASLAALVSVGAHAQDMDRVTFEQCNTASFFENIDNGTTVLQYVSANGAVLTVGDTLVLDVPGGSRATGGGTYGGSSTTSTGGGGSVTAGASFSTRTNISSQYQTIIKGKPGLGRTIGRVGTMGAVGAIGAAGGNHVSGDMQGQIVVVAEMSLHHDGGRRKPLELTVLLGEPNGRAFGINKYLSTSDYEASVIQGELKPLRGTPLTRDEAIAKLKEAKDLLDLGLIGEEEYNKMKDELSPVIVGN